MDFAKRMPMWIWWAGGAVVIAAVAAGVYFWTRSITPSIPPNLVEKRNAVAKVLDDSSRIADVDLKPLLDFETKKDYRGAVQLVEQALIANAQHEELARSLVAVSGELVNLAIQVEPDGVGTQAIESFRILAKLAEAEKKFYADRKALYEMTRDYYAAMAAKKNPAIPDALRTLVTVVNDDLVQAKNLNSQFSAAVKAFDAAVGTQ